MAKQNLSAAYLMQGARRRYRAFLTRAIDAADEALSVITLQGAPLRWAHCQCFSPAREPFGSTKILSRAGAYGVRLSIPFISDNRDRTRRRQFFGLFLVLDGPDRRGDF